jgi:hypothetical protein
VKEKKERKKERKKIGGFLGFLLCASRNSSEVEKLVLIGTHTTHRILQALALSSLPPFLLISHFLLPRLVLRSLSDSPRPRKIC